MAKLVQNLRKKSLLRLVLIVAVLLAAAILIRWLASDRTDLTTPEGRQSFLKEQGWEIDTDSEEHKTVRIPAEMSGIITEYNRIQLEQGYDLEKHLGQSCEQYSYRVTNFPDENQTVLVTLYIQKGKLIAGDVHSTALNGFMQGLKRE